MNEDRIKRLRELVFAKLCLLINRDYVLLDVPNHPNIGDNLIWEGELNFLKHYFRDYKLKYSANVINGDLSNVGKNDIILMHGGGNWGDLYPECQALRMEVVKLYPNNRIIIFPQSVHYRDYSKLKEESEIFNSHSDIYICLRDEVSYNLLKQYIDECKLLLLPDMAFFVDISYHNIKTLNKNLFLLRTDYEAIERSYMEFRNQDFVIHDWPSLVENKYLQYLFNYYIYFKQKLSVFLQNKRFFSCLVSPVYGLNCRNNRERYIERGVNFLAPYNKIFTTRLHGLILALLMNKTVYIVDNKYAKCRNFYETWLKDFDNIYILTD